MLSAAMPDMDCFFDFNEAASFLDAIAPHAATPASLHSGHTLSPESTHSQSAIPFQDAGWVPYDNPYPDFSAPDSRAPPRPTDPYDRPSSASNSLRALYHSNSSAPTSPDLLAANPVKQEYGGMDVPDPSGFDDLAAPPPHPAAARPGRVSKPRGKDKTNHNLIEKKYRTNINAKILMLRDAVPTLRFAAGAEQDVPVAALGGLTPASKLNKASIFTKATEYIQHLEQKVDHLANQNRELQAMLNAATSATSGRHITPNLDMAPHTNLDMAPHTGLPYPAPNQMRNHANFDFSYNGPDPSYGLTPMQQSFSGSSLLGAGAAGDPSTHDGRGSKLLMGGMAAVMATSLFGGQNQNDVRGLGALPFANYLPRALILDAPIAAHLARTIKACLVLAALYSVLAPYIASWFLPKLPKPRTATGAPSASAIAKNRVLVALRLQVPQPLSPRARASILTRLGGRAAAPAPFRALLLDYLTLLASADSFETCFLTLVVGSMLLVQRPALAVLLNHAMSVKGRLLLNLEYKGDDASLAAIKRLIASVDDLAWLGLPSLARRVLNVVSGRPLHHLVTDDCREHQRYLQIYHRSGGDFYRMWRDWRALQVAAALNAVGLECPERAAECVKDLAKLGAAIQDECPVKLYVKMVAALACPQAVGAAVQAVQARVARQSLCFTLAAEGLDLTDGELSADDESLDAKMLDNASAGALDASDGALDASDDSDADATPPPHKPATPHQTATAKLSKSLVSSLGLVSPEEYLVCATTMILHFHHQGQDRDARQLLDALCISRDTPILFLAFTGLVRLVEGLVPEIETSPVLETCAVSAMSFLRDPRTRNCISSAGRIRLSKMLVAKCKTLNGINESA